eukprot:scaffold91188_cov16-Tisochrysis_lutea.AAC.2
MSSQSWAGRLAGAGLFIIRPELGQMEAKEQGQHDARCSAMNLDPRFALVYERCAHAVQAISRAGSTKPSPMQMAELVQG